MKTLLLNFKWIILVVAMLATQQTLAYDFMVDGLCYNITGNKTVEVARQNNTSLKGDISIPSSVVYNGTNYLVIAICGRAFSRCSELTSVTISNSMTTIGWWAFEDCVSLTSVSIPNSVTSIEINPFKGCTNLRTITVESGNSRYDSRDSCNAIIETATNTLISGCKNTTIPNSVTAIDEDAFFDCAGLISVTIPNSVIAIGDYAFLGCTGLTSVTWNVKKLNDFSSANDTPFAGLTGIKTFIFGDNVEIIPACMCSKLTGLTTVTMGNSVTSIGNSAFSGCSNLTSVNIPNSVTSIGDGAFDGCKDLTSIMIPSSVITLGQNAFSGCSGLTSVSWNVKSFDDFTPIGISPYTTSPFAGLTNIKTFIFGERVERIPALMCSGLTGLTSLTIGNSVTTIGSNAFKGCSSLTNLTIPNSVTEIGGGSFSSCSGLTSVTIPNSVTTIGSGTFMNCSGLTSATIGKSVTYIGPSAFEGCKGLISVNIPNLVTTIGEQAFSGCGCLKSITIGNSVIAIAFGTFFNCSSLTSVTMGNSVTEIGRYAFEGCSRLTSVEIPNSVTSIGSGAFYCCSGLTSVSIPNSVTSIGDEAFEYCGGLTSVTIGNSVTTIGRLAFSETPWYNNQPDGLVYAGLVAYRYKGTMPDNTSITLREGTLGIAASAFSTCSGLTSVTIPNSVTTIGDDAFYSCAGLTSLTIPNSVTTIGNSAFYKCSGLTSVTIPESVTTIGKCALAYCSGLTSVIIPNSVTTIGASAFSGCNSLTSVEIPNSVTTIGSLAFYECSGLTSVNIPNSVTTIGERAFSDCCNLESIYSYANASDMTLGNMVFRGVNNSTCVLYVPSLFLKSYKSASQWMDFKHIVVSDYKIIGHDISHIRGDNNLEKEMPVELLNNSPISAIQFILSLPDGLSLATDSYNNFDIWLDDNRKSRNHSVEVESKGNNTYLVVISSPTNNVLKGNDGILLSYMIQFDQFHSVVGNNKISYSDILMVGADEIQYTATNTDTNVEFSYLLGDANADMVVDVADYVVTNNYILGRSSDTYFFSDAANAASNDNTINVADLVAITNIALGIRQQDIRPAPRHNGGVAMCGWPEMVARSSRDGNGLTQVVIDLSNGMDVSALQMDLTLPEGMALVDAALSERAPRHSVTTATLPDGKVRLLVSAFSANDITAGNGNLLTLTLSGNSQRGDLFTVGDILVAERNLSQYELQAITLDVSNVTDVTDVMASDEIRIYVENGNVVIESSVAGVAQLIRMNGITTLLRVEAGRNVYPMNGNPGVYLVRMGDSVKKLKF